MGWKSGLLVKALDGMNHHLMRVAPMALFGRIGVHPITDASEMRVATNHNLTDPVVQRIAERARDLSGGPT